MVCRARPSIFSGFVRSAALDYPFSQDSYGLTRQTIDFFRIRTACRARPSIFAGFIWSAAQNAPITHMIEGLRVSKNLIY